jgi:hypothetical protein
MKTLQRRAHPRCPIKRHDVKWPSDAPVVSFAGARLCRGRPGFGLRPNIWLVSQI